MDEKSVAALKNVISNMTNSGAWRLERPQGYNFEMLIMNSTKSYCFSTEPH